MYVVENRRLGEVRKWGHPRRHAPAGGATARDVAGFGDPVFNVACAPPPGCAPIAAAGCRGAVRAAVREAIRLAVNAANRVDAAIAVPPANRDASARQTARFFTFFFGHDPSRPIAWAGNQESGVSVAARFRSVANELNGGRRVTFHCLPTRAGCGADLTCCDPDQNAWFSTGVRNAVNLCDGFWNPPAGLRGLPGVNFRAAVIIHEMLHMLFEDLRDAGHGRPRAACYEAFALRAAGFGADPIDVTRCRPT